MAKKEQLKKDLQNKFNELKTEINLENFDKDFKEILDLIDEEKIEPNEISTLNEKDKKDLLNIIEKTKII